MITPDIVAEIAARYGAGVAPGATVRRIPQGTSGRPLPVWDPAKNTLVVPDWVEQKAAARRAIGRKIAAARKRNRAQDAELVAKLQGLHAAGARTAAMAEATGLTVGQVHRVLRQIGLTVERVPPGPSQATLQKLADIRAALARGLSRAAIAEATGFADVRHLGQFVHRHAPDIALPSNRGRRAAQCAPSPTPASQSGLARQAVPATRPARLQARDARILALIAEGASVMRIGLELGLKDARPLRHVIRRLAPDFDFAGGHAVDLAERDRLVVKLYPGMSKPVMADHLGLTVPQITAAIKRARAAGLLPATSDAPPPKREKRRPKGLAYHGHRNDRILDLHRQGWTIEAIMAETGVRRDPIARLLWANGESVRNERSTRAAGRVAELPDLIAQRMDGKAIAAHWGVTLGTVYQIAHRAGLSLAGQSAGSDSPYRHRAMSRKVALRRERVRQMLMAGAKHADMLPVLQVSHATLSSDIKALGLSGQSQYARRSSKRQSEAKPDPAPEGDAAAERRAA